MASSDTPVQDPTTYGRATDVVDPLHPAASAFAPLQPGAGVVADDADERGQNLAKGTKASKAEKDNQDQPEKLRAQFDRDQRSAVVTAAAPVIEGTEAKPASSKK